MDGLFSECVWTTESIETEGAAEEDEEVEKECMAYHTWGCRSIAWQHWCQSVIKGCENGEDEQGAVVLVWRKDEEDGFE